jgi:hypothetical protein
LYSSSTKLSPKPCLMYSSSTKISSKTCPFIHHPHHQVSSKPRQCIITHQLSSKSYQCIHHPPKYPSKPCPMYVFINAHQAPIQSAAARYSFIHQPR